MMGVRLICVAHRRLLPDMTNAEKLKSNGLKATLPRIKILALFEKSEQRHLSADHIHKALIAEGNDVGLATVYRVLLQFEQAGLLQRSHFESEKSVFELNEGSHHDHLVCIDCGHIEEFFDAEIEERQHVVAERHGYKLQDHALSLYAHCTRTAPCEHRQRREVAGLLPEPVGDDRETV